MDLDERFWSASLDELKQGYVYDAAEDSYICLVCGERFEDGEIFRLPQSDRFYEARKYAAYHVNEAHHSMLEYLLGLEKKTTGLTELQKSLIRDFAEGLTDREIVEKAGSGSASTIRNHRFVLKEKAKQAKLQLAIMELMEQGLGLGTVPKFVTIHRTATQVDERFAITEEEYEQVLRDYFPDGPDGPLTSFPRKEKRKIVILHHLSSLFDRGTQYTEKQVNEILKPFSEEDYVTLRRYLIEYGYLDREEDGSAYWVKR